MRPILLSILKLLLKSLAIVVGVAIFALGIYLLRVNNLDEGTQEYKFLFQSVEEIQKQYPELKMVAFGGTNPEIKEEYSLTFNIDRKFTIDEARAFVLPFVGDLVPIINKHSLAQRKRPFTLDNLDLSILFYDKNHVTPVNPLVGTVWVGKNRVTYLMEYSSKRGGKFKEYEETIQEAFKKGMVN